MSLFVSMQQIYILPYWAVIYFTNIVGVFGSFANLNFYELHNQNQFRCVENSSKNEIIEESVIMLQKVLAN